MPTTISDSKALDLWNKYAADTHGELDKMPDEAEKDGIELIRAVFELGREHEYEHADPRRDPRPWQDCTHKDIRKGDLVEALDKDGLRIGVAHHQNTFGDWFTEANYLLTYDDHWPLRRIPAPTPEKETAMTETTPAASSEPLARTLIAVPDTHGAPHHDADQIKAGDYVVQVDQSGVVRHGLAHHQGADGDWATEDGKTVAWATIRADRPDAVTVWPAPATPAEEVELPGEDGAVIISAEGRSAIKSHDPGRPNLYTCHYVLRRRDGFWYGDGADDGVPGEHIIPGTWQVLTDGTPRFVKETNQ